MVSRTIKLYYYNGFLFFSFSGHHQRNSTKSLMEIQAEEARKANQQDQIKQQQYRQQQQQQQKVLIDYYCSTLSNLFPRR